MAAATFTMNTDSWEPFDNFTHVPKGEWNAVIKSMEFVREENKPDLLVPCFEIVEGSAKGGILEKKLAIWMAEDPNKKGGGWPGISKRIMRSITDAVGVHGDFVPAQLVGKFLTINTDIKFQLKNDGSGQYMPFPELKSLKPFVGQGRAAGADAVQPTPPAANVGGASAAAPQLPQMGASALPTLPQMGNFAPPAAPPVATQQAPVQMPQGFQMPGQQTAPMAPPPGMPQMGMQMPQMGGFAPPAAPAGMPAFQAPPMGGPGPWAGGAPR